MNKLLMLTCLRSIDPCGFTGATFSIYANQLLHKLLGKAGSEDSSHAMAVFQEQGKQIRNQQPSLSVINILPCGSEQIIQPYLFDFFQLFNEDGDCNGVFCYARPFPFFSLLACVDNKLPCLVTAQTPDNIFTEREWDIIFFLLNRLENKEIAKRLNLSHCTIESRLQVISNNLGLNNSSKLRKFCEVKSIDHHIPPKISSYRQSRH